MSQATPLRWFRFGLRGWFVAVTAFAGWLALVLAYPPIVLFASSLALTGFCTWQNVRRRKSWKRLLPITIAAWLLLYIASLGPAAYFANKFPTTEPVVLNVYAPFILLDESPMHDTRFWQWFREEYVFPWKNLADPLPED
ncbi:MAG TPA: hypothetical protein VGJ26_18620 [Pirellulales bacterium]|jgi:hypothetical protein